MILCVLLLPCLAHADDFTEVPRTEKQLKLENECFKRHHELRQQHPDPKELGEAWKAE